MIRQRGFWPRLDDSVHNGLSVRPAPWQGQEPGVSPGERGPIGLDAAFPTGARLRAARTEGTLSVPPVAFLYIHSRLIHNLPLSPGLDGRAMLNEVYNNRILELAGNIPRLGRMAAPD